MTDNFFEKISSEFKPQSLSLNKGDKLFNQGDSVTNIYFIENGKIKLTRNTLDGSLLILHIGQQGESIAEASIFSDQYHCSAVAAVDSEILFVKKHKLLQVLNETPKAMMDLLAVFSRQVRDLRAINEMRNIRSASERTLAFIRCNVNENKEMKLDGSLKDIAHKIGLAHETFYRELKNLENSGMLTRNPDRITLL